MTAKSVNYLNSWEKYVIDPHAPTDAKTLQFTADYTLDAVFSKAENIDLSFLELNKVNGEHLALVLRCISSWKDFIPSWDYGLELARKTLIQENKDPNDVLFGLI
jgi:hypothetical protein